MGFKNIHLGHVFSPQGNALRISTSSEAMALPKVQNIKETTFGPYCFKAILEHGKQKLYYLGNSSLDLGLI